VVVQQSGHGRSEVEIGSGHGRGIREDRVQDVAAGSNQQADADALFHSSYVLGVADLEGDMPHRWRAAGKDLVEQAPSGQLDNGAAQQTVGGECVAGQACPVHERHVVSHAGQQHGGCRTAAPGADHDDVVRPMAFTHPESPFRPFLPRATTVRSGPDGRLSIRYSMPPVGCGA
jgi:hypothetical protein